MLPYNLHSENTIGLCEGLQILVRGKQLSMLIPVLIAAGRMKTAPTLIGSSQVS